MAAAAKKETEAEGLDERLLTTTSPHVRAPDDIPRVMWTVVVALLPALFAACYFVVWDAVRIVAIAVVSAVAAEALIQKLTGREVTIGDGSAVVTGLLVAFVMPSNAPWFAPLVASVFGIAVVKQAFGGLGCNIWNPALAGRAFAVACFGGLMVGGWMSIAPRPDADPPVEGRPANWVRITPGQRFAPDDEYTRADAVTGASALSARKDYLSGLPGTDDAELLQERLGSTPRETLRKVQAANHTGRLDLFLGAQVGSLGETSALALLVGGVILLATGTIRWYIPVAFLGSVALFGWLLPVQVPALDGTQVVRGWVWAGGEPLFQILTGGVMIGAIFMATDMVTSPLTRLGKLIFGAGCGLLTVIIRKYGGYPEGVCYSILLMNTAVPLIDAYTKPRVYGT
ncbi:MAG: RnfABCDGE type electron transport complex subunit D [Planctomycetota bacterium]